MNILRCVALYNIYLLFSFFWLSFLVSFITYFMYIYILAICLWYM